MENKMTLFGRKFARTLEEIDHRPFAHSKHPWIINQSWAKLLFAHWVIPVAVMRQVVPEQFELDLYEGQAYIGVVPFLMREVSPRYVPSLPWLSYFPELNVRTYVTHSGQPGVYFFSLDACNPIAVWIARTFYLLPYFNAAMQCKVSVGSNGQQINYRSRRNSKTICSLDVTYGPDGDIYRSRPGSLDYFLTERYCLFTLAHGHVYRGDIHHKPWPLQPAWAQWAENLMVEPLGLKLEGQPILHYVENIDTIEWAIRK